MFWPLVLMRDHFIDRLDWCKNYHNNPSFLAKKTWDSKANFFEPIFQLIENFFAFPKMQYFFPCNGNIEKRIGACEQLD